MPRQLQLKREPDPKLARQRTGLGQAAFASMLGVTVRTVQRWELGQHKPRGPASILVLLTQLHSDKVMKVLRH